MAFRPTRFIGSPIVVILAGALVGCASPLSPGERRQLNAAEARWAARPFESYAVEMRIGCFFCPLNQWSRVEVVNGSVTRVVSLETGAEVGPEERGRFLSVEQLFDEIDRVSVQAWVDDVVVEFDPQLGYPTLVRFEADDGILDAGSERLLRNAVALP